MKELGIYIRRGNILGLKADKDDKNIYNTNKGYNK
jgi:hypothetical protein